jgi:hypothetical protein
VKDTKAWEETDSTQMVSFVLETGRRIGLQYHSLLSFDVIEDTVLLTFSGCVFTLTFRLPQEEIIAFVRCLQRHRLLELKQSPKILIEYEDTSEIARRSHAIPHAWTT